YGPDRQWRKLVAQLRPRIGPQKSQFEAHQLQHYHSVNSHSRVMWIPGLPADWNRGGNREPQLGDHLDWSNALVLNPSRREHRSRVSGGSDTGYVQLLVMRWPLTAVIAGHPPSV